VSTEVPKRVRWGVHHTAEEVKDYADALRDAALLKLQMDGLGHLTGQLITVMHEDGSRTMFIKLRNR
jgi:hypothetical protein